MFGLLQSGAGSPSLVRAEMISFSLPDKTRTTDTVREELPPAMQCFPRIGVVDEPRMIRGVYPASLKTIFRCLRFGIFEKAICDARDASSVTRLRLGRKHILRLPIINSKYLPMVNKYIQIVVVLIFVMSR